MKTNRVLFFYIIICILFFGCLILLRTTDDDEIDISYHAMQATDEAYINNDLGIIDVPEGGIDSDDHVYGRVGEYSLQAGTYDFLIVHACPEDSILKFKSGNEEIKTEKLPGKQSETKIQLKLERPSDNFCMEFSYPGKENIQLKHILIRSHGLFFTDSVFSGLLLACIFIIPVFYRINNIKPNVYLSGVFFAAIIISVPLLSGQYIGGFDIGFHLMRLEGIRDGILDGQFPVVIYPAAKSGHGYMGALYPSLFMYIPAGLRFLGISEPDAFNFFLIMISFFTGWSMFASVKGITGCEKTALIAAVTYILMPFRIFNIYTGSEVGALLGMAFFPLVIWGIYEVVLGDFKKWPVLTLAYTGLIGSHVLSVLFMIIFCTIFCLVFIKDLFSEKKRWTSLLIAALWCVLLNLFFLVPFLYYRQGLRYDSVLRGKDPAQYMLTIGELFRVSPSDTLLPTAGPVILVVLFVISVFFMEKRQDEIKLCNGLLFCFITGFAALIAVTPLFPWNELKKMESLWYIIKIIQLPWRLLSITCALLCIVFSAALIKSDILNKYSGVIIASVIVLCLISDYSIMDKHELKALNDDKTAGGWNCDTTDEYTPGNYTSDKDMVEDRLPVTEEGIIVSDYVKSGTNISFSYSSEKDGSIRLPLIYYHGYVAKTASGSKLQISESDIGTITVELPASKNEQITVKHTEPWYLRVAEIVSVTAFFVFCFLYFFRKRKQIKIV